MGTECNSALSVSEKFIAYPNDRTAIGISQIGISISRADSIISRIVIIIYRIVIIINRIAISINRTAISISQTAISISRIVIIINRIAISINRTPISISQTAIIINRIAIIINRTAISINQIGISISRAASIISRIGIIINWIVINVSVDAIITFAIKINTIMVAINLFLNQTKFFEVDVVFLVFYMLSIMGTVCITALSVSEKFIVYPSDRVIWKKREFFKALRSVASRSGELRNCIFSVKNKISCERKM